MNKYSAVIPPNHHPKPKTLDYILATEDFSALQAYVNDNYDPPVSLDQWSEVAFSRIHEYVSCDGLTVKKAVDKLYMDRFRSVLKGTTMKTIDAEIKRLEELRRTYGGDADPTTCVLTTYTFDARIVGHCHVSVQARSLQDAESRARLDVERVCKEIPALDLRDKAVDLTLLGSLKH